MRIVEHAKVVLNLTLFVATENYEVSTTNIEKRMTYLGVPDTSDAVATKLLGHIVATKKTFCAPDNDNARLLFLSIFYTTRHIFIGTQSSISIHC